MSQPSPSVVSITGARDKQVNGGMDHEEAKEQVRIRSGRPCVGLWPSQSGKGPGPARGQSSAAQRSVKKHPGRQKVSGGIQTAASGELGPASSLVVGGYAKASDDFPAGDEPGGIV